MRWGLQEVNHRCRNEFFIWGSGKRLLFFPYTQHYNFLRCLCMIDVQNVQNNKIKIIFSHFLSGFTVWQHLCASALHSLDVTFIPIRNTVGAPLQRMKLSSYLSIVANKIPGPETTPHLLIAYCVGIAASIAYTRAMPRSRGGLYIPVACAELTDEAGTLPGQKAEIRNCPEKFWDGWQLFLSLATHNILSQRTYRIST